jgi:type II secretory pathway component PulF
MTVFAYKAASTGTPLVAGTITADSPRQARDQLRSRGLVVHEISSQAVTRRFNWWPLVRRGRHAAKVASTIRELATLLGAGIPLLESLDALAQQHRGSFRASLLAVRERVAAGSSLGEAMRDQPEVFDDLCVQMVAVGEDSGTLEVVLDQLRHAADRSLPPPDEGAVRPHGLPSPIASRNGDLDDQTSPRRARPRPLLPQPMPRPSLAGAHPQCHDPVTH